MAEKSYTLTVKRGKVEFTLDRKEVMAIDETPDGEIRTYNWAPDSIGPFLPLPH